MAVKTENKEKKTFMFALHKHVIVTSTERHRVVINAERASLFEPSLLLDLRFLSVPLLWEALVSQVMTGDNPNHLEKKENNLMLKTYTQTRLKLKGSEPVWPNPQMLS